MPLDRARTALIVCVAVLVAAALPAAAAGRPVAPGNAASTSGPRLLVPAGVRNAALTCDGDVTGSPHTPVLLVHGTGSTPEENWGVFGPALRARGIPTCGVALPHRGTRDVQVSTEYVVHAIRSVSARRGGRIDVLGHSQGGTLPVVALKYWPDLAGLVDDYVGLAPALSSPATGDVLCTTPCQAPFQQLRSDSVWFSNISAHPLPSGPDYTTIASLTDEIVFPQPQASHLEGATNIVLQEVCPAKVVDHFAMSSDGSVFALALDGLVEPGPTDPARLPLTACADTYPAGSDPVVSSVTAADAIAKDLEANRNAERVDREPTPRCYLRRDCADVTDRGRLLRSAVARRDGGRVVVDLEVQAPGTILLTVRRGVVPVRQHELAVRPGSRAVLLERVPRDAALEVAVSTTTSWYTAAGIEATLRLPAAAPVAAAPAAAAPASAALPATGAAPLLTLGGALLVLLAGVLRRRNAF